MARDILIVDDSAAIRKILQRVLSQGEAPLGEIYEASDGVEALAVLRQHRVELVLTDINMPNMDGLQLLSHIRSMEEFKHLPVLIITTDGSQAKVMEAVNLGANGYVRKPFTADQIRDKLAAIV